MRKSYREWYTTSQSWEIWTHNQLFGGIPKNNVVFTKSQKPSLLKHVLNMLKIWNCHNGNLWTQRRWPIFCQPFDAKKSAEFHTVAMYTFFLVQESMYIAMKTMYYVSVCSNSWIGVGKSFSYASPELYPSLPRSIHWRKRPVFSCILLPVIFVKPKKVGPYLLPCTYVFL